MNSFIHFNKFISKAMNKCTELISFMFVIFSFINIVNSLSANTSSEKILEDSSAMNTVLINVLKLCTPDLKTVIINDESTSTIDFFLQSPNLINVIALDNSVIHRNHKPLYKIHAFIVAINSTEQLENMLHVFKDSQWWHIEIPLFIVDRSGTFCNQASTVFEIAWDMNLISSYFFCTNDEGELQIYTYNPYSNQIPNIWNPILKSDKYDRLTVFNRSYDEENICTGFNFDRTAILDGTPIRIAARMRASKGTQENQKQKNNRINRYYSDIGKAMKYSINNTFRFTTDLRTLKGQDFYNFLNNGSFDLAFVDKYNPIYPEISITYPIWYYQYYIIATMKDPLTPLEKIWNFYGISILMFTFSMIVITFLVLLLIMKKKTSVAAFEVLRLVTNTSLYTQINGFPLRLFFATIFIYFLIIQSTFQGHLSQFLTKYESKPSITSIEDLKDPKYQFISAPIELASCMMDSVLKKKMFHTKNKECMTAIRQNKSLACIRTYDFISDDIPYFRHLYKVELFDTLNYYTFVTRDDWPLKNRIDTVMMFLEQAHLAKKWRDRLNRIILFIEKNIYGFRRYEPMETIKPIPLHSLKFAFQFWLMGMFSSIICFMYELTSSNKHKMDKIRKQTMKIKKFFSKNCN